VALDEVFNYFRGYDKRTFEVFTCQGSEPSDVDVASFEVKVGYRLPDEFREFTMSGLGGLYMEVREELWPRPKSFDVSPFWSFLYGLKVFGIAEGIPDWLDIRAQYSEFKTEGFPDLVPFLQRVGDPTSTASTPVAKSSAGRMKSRRDARLMTYLSGTF